MGHRDSLRHAHLAVGISISELVLRADHWAALAAVTLDDRPNRESWCDPFPCREIARAGVTVVAAHQLNCLAGASVMTKIAAADIVIWEDTLEFTRGYEHRNRLANGRWFTVPVEYGSTGEPLNLVRIAAAAENGKGWRQPLAANLRRSWPGPVTDEICDVILTPHRKLLGLNQAIMEILFRALAITTRQRYQSMLEAGQAWPGSAFNSERLADMVAEVGGTVYLSGPSGRRYLEEDPFVRRGIRVDYWEHEGENPCALALVDQRELVAA